LAERECVVTRAACARSHPLPRSTLYRPNSTITPVAYQAAFHEREPRLRDDNFEPITTLDQLARLYEHHYAKMYGRAA
jgi:hypothetical protein